MISYDIHDILYTHTLGPCPVVIREASSYSIWETIETKPQVKSGELHRRREGRMEGARKIKNTRRTCPHNLLSKDHRDSRRPKQKFQRLHGSFLSSLHNCHIIQFKVFVGLLEVVVGTVSDSFASPWNSFPSTGVSNSILI